MFIHIWLILPLGLKFAAFISIIAAEAISPTTTGRRPEKIALIAPLWLWRRMKCALYKTRKKLGTVTANVARTEPKIPQPIPCREGSTLPGATKPMYVAEFMPIGPGVIWEIATTSVNMVSVIHPGSTTAFSTSDNIAYPPPNPKMPIFRYAHINFKYIDILIHVFFSRNPPKKEAAETSKDNIEYRT